MNESMIESSNQLKNGCENLLTYLLTSSVVYILLGRQLVEVLDTLDNLQLLIDSRSVQVYRHISKMSFQLTDIMKDHLLSSDEIPQLDTILRSFIDLSCHREG